MLTLTDLKSLSNLKKQHTNLHHLQFLRICQISWSWLVAYDIGLDVNVRPVDQPLLDILQHLLHHGVKGPQLSSCTQMHRQVSVESSYQTFKTTLT